MMPPHFPSPLFEPEPQSRRPQRILIIKPSSLGDVTHALPVLRLLRRKWPAAQISWLVAPYCAGLLEGHKDLDEVILFDRRRFGTAWKSPSAGLELIRFKRDLRRRKFDLVIDLQGLLRSGWLAFYTGAPVRIGFANAREFAPLFYTHRVPIEDVEQHAVDRYLKIAAALGCETSPVEFDFPLTDADREYVDSIIPAEPFAVLLPGTNWPTKRWPAEHFEELVEPLRERFGLASVLAGGADAAELAPQIPGALNLAGRTSLPQLVALLQRASLVVANDSGPMHIAAALGRPLVTMFGPTNPVRTGPYGRPECVVELELPCSPCYRRYCAHQSCLRWLSIEPVLEAAQGQLAPHASSASTFAAQMKSFSDSPPTECVE
jgi:heptosyltransferase-1